MRSRRASWVIDDGAEQEMVKSRGGISCEGCWGCLVSCGESERERGGGERRVKDGVKMRWMWTYEKSMSTGWLWTEGCD